MIARPTPVASRDVRRAVTVEQALYVAAFVVGLAVRFGGIGQRPLNSLEAWNAWSAWQAASGLPGPSELTPTSPLWHNLQTLLFWLWPTTGAGADGDAWARVISATAGAALVLAPWMLRGLMGRPAALILSALFALDPWLIAFSRLSDGAMLSATLAVALLSATVLLLERCERGREGRPGPTQAMAEHRHLSHQRLLRILLAIGAGLFAVSGHMAWGFAPVLLVFGALNWRAIRGVQGNPAAVGSEAGLWFAVSAVAAATAGFAMLGGIGLVSASLTMWLDSALATGAPVPASTMQGGYALGWPLTRLLVDQPLLAVFGIGGLVYLQVRSAPRSAQRAHALRQDQDHFADGIHWRLTLWLWLAWGGLLCLLPGRSPFSLLVLVIPLLIGAAYALDGLWAGARTYARSQETLALLLTLAVLGVSASFWSIALVSDAAFSSSAAQAVVVIVGLAIAIVVLYGAWSSAPHALWVAAAAISAILIMASVSSAWQLNHRASSERRDGVFREAGSPDLRRLADDIATLSAHRAGSPLEIPVFVQSTRYIEQPQTASEGLPPAYRTPDSGEDVLVGWYLRSMKRVTWGGLPQQTNGVATAPLFVQAYSGDPLSAPMPAQEYSGSDYVVRVSWLPDSLGERGSAADGEPAETRLWLNLRLGELWPATIQPRLRWALFRRATTPPQEEGIILWAERDDAAGLGVLQVNRD